LVKVGHHHLLDVEEKQFHLIGDGVEVQLVEDIAKVAFIVPLVADALDHLLLVLLEDLADGFAVDLDV
jgi:hypothetical protein